MEKPSKEDLKRLTNADLTDEEDEKLSAIALADTLSSGALTAEREESAKEQRPLDEMKEPAPEKAPPEKPEPEETSSEKPPQEDA
jgi:hypothetical protein